MISTDESSPDLRVGYGVAVASVLGVALLRYALIPIVGTHVPLLPFVIPVIIAGWFGGLRPALLASVLGTAISVFVFFPPPFTLMKVMSPERFGIPMLILVCVMLSIVFGALHASRRRTETHERILQREILARAEASAEIARLNGQLQDRVQELESLLDIMPAGVWMADPACEHIHGNRAAYAMLGVPAGTEVSLTAPDIKAGRIRLPYRIHVAGREVAPEDLIMQRVGRTGLAVLGEEQEIRFDDGRSILLNCSVVPLLDADGRVRKVMGVYADVTATRRNADELRHSAGRSRLLWEATALLLSPATPDVVLRRLFDTLAPHLQLDMYFNYMVEDGGAGLRLASYAGMEEHEVGAIRHLAFGQAVCGAVARSREPIAAFHIQDSHHRMLRLVRDAGLSAYVCHPLVAGKRLLGTLSFGSRTRATFEPDEIELLSSICACVSLAYEREDLVRRLRAGDRRKDEFLATLSHELRNPLAPIRNAAQILQARTSDPAVQWAGQVIGRQVHHLVRLLEDLLDTSRIIHDKVELRREITDIASILHSAVETSRPLIEAGHHVLDIELPEEPLRVNADPVRLAQVFTNLLNNAARYTDPGGHIRLVAERRDEFLMVRVRDDGIGMDRTILTRLFEPFAQGAVAMHRSPGGLGLGLALVHGLVELHGGSVTARSDGPGTGSEFVVRLPVHAGVPEPAAAIDAAAPAAHRVSRRALVVDDQADGADSLARMLEMCGHEVRVAYDAHEAIVTADRFEPELVLLDIGMPHTNGYDVCRRMRGQPWARGALFVAVTGWGRDEDRRKSAEAGFDHHLVKPLDLAALERLLEEHAVVPRGVLT